MFEFDLIACEHDSEGYYYPRWDRATPITVTAPDKQTAINTAAVALGGCRRGFYWGFKVKAIRSAVTA